MSDGPFGRRGDAGDPPPAPDPVREPLPEPPPRAPRGLVSNATWLAGVGLFFLLAVVIINGMRTDGPGAGGLTIGSPLPVFAAPLALSDLEGDANVSPTADDGVRAACDVRGPKVVNICELRDRGPVVIVFTVTRSKRCEDQVDVVERLRPRFPKISFAAVAVKGNREEVRKLVRENGWGLPVAHDRDGAVANNYGVAICPTMTLAGSDGKVAATALGYQTAEQLFRRLETLK